MTKFLEKIGRGVGVVVSALYQSGRDSIDQVIKNILPFMCFTPTLRKNRCGPIPPVDLFLGPENGTTFWGGASVTWSI